MEKRPIRSSTYRQLDDEVLNVVCFMGPDLQCVKEAHWQQHSKTALKRSVESIAFHGPDLQSVKEAHWQQHSKTALKRPVECTAFYGA